MLSGYREAGVEVWIGLALGVVIKVDLQCRELRNDASNNDLIE